MWDQATVEEALKRINLELRYCSDAQAKGLLMARAVISQMCPAKPSLRDKVLKLGTKTRIVPINS